MVHWILVELENDSFGFLGFSKKKKKSQWKSAWLSYEVGWRSFLTYILFHILVFDKVNKESGKNEMYVVVALGSRDRSFSVWTTSLKRPFFVINDAFDQGVLDMSWSRDGKIFYFFISECYILRCVRLFCFKPTLSLLANIIIPRP